MVNTRLLDSTLDSRPDRERVAKERRGEILASHEAKVKAIATATTANAATGDSWLLHINRNLCSSIFSFLSLCDGMSFAITSHMMMFVSLMPSSAPLFASIPSTDLMDLISRFCVQPRLQRLIVRDVPGDDADHREDIMRDIMVIDVLTSLVELTIECEIEFDYTFSLLPSLVKLERLSLCFAPDQPIEFCFDFSRYPALQYLEIKAPSGVSRETMMKLPPSLKSYIGPIPFAYAVEPVPCGFKAGVTSLVLSSSYLGEFSEFAWIGLRPEQLFPDSLVSLVCRCWHENVAPVDFVRWFCRHPGLTKLRIIRIDGLAPLSYPLDVVRSLLQQCYRLLRQRFPDCLISIPWL